MNDGDCDDHVVTAIVLIYKVGAYSMNDGDCDRLDCDSTSHTAGRSVFHE